MRTSTQGGTTKLPLTKSAGRNANGTGSIRKVTSTRNGKEYTYWQARYTAGYDPGTGKQIQRSITGKTQKEVAQKLRAITSALDAGTYIEPNRQTVAEWLDEWTDNYLGNIKPRTVSIYKSDIDLHIKPALGAVRLDSLDTPMIQSFYNGMLTPSKKGVVGLSPKTIKNIHGVLHKALEQAVLVGKLQTNPSRACVLPRIEKAKITPFNDAQIAAFLHAIKGNRFETIFLATLFTGLREGEILGLTWDCINLDTGIIFIDKQLQLHQEPGCEAYQLVPTKNSKGRSITAAPTVIQHLKKVRVQQEKQKAIAGDAWSNPNNLVFTDAFGAHLTKSTVYREFKKIATAIGRPDARFHDLRHSYAVAAIRNGDDIKTVQENLGHATASFTLDVYGHVTAQMKRESANRMETYISNMTKPKLQKDKIRPKIRLTPQK